MRRLVTIVALLVSAAALISVERAPERPLAQQPFPDSAEYADGARSIAAGDGYYTRVHEGERQPPRYPPGYSLALTPFAAVGEFPRNVQRGSKAFAMAYVVIALVAGWLLGGPLALGLTAAFVWSSPFARESAGLVLSDAWVASLAVLSLPLLRPVTTSGTRLAAALGGVAALTRLTAGLQLVALLTAVPRRSRAQVVLFALPGLVILALVQLAIFGNPLRTGYDYWGVADHVFSPDFLLSSSVPKEGPFIIADRLDGDLLQIACPCPVGGPQADLPNALFYPLVLAGAFWVYAPPGVALVGLAYAIKRRREAVGRYALVLVGTSLVLFCLYFYQGTRFMAGPATVLTVLGAVGIAEAVESQWAKRFGARTSASAI